MVANPIVAVVDRSTSPRALTHRNVDLTPYVPFATDPAPALR